MAEDIYYDDLENYDHDVGNVLELKAENGLLEERIKEMTNTIQVMTKALSKPSVLVDGLRKWMLSFQDEYDDLQLKYNDMSTNFSSLIKTVRAELGRKDRMIADLNREKDEIIFNKHRIRTPPVVLSEVLQVRKRRNSPIESDAKRPKFVSMNQRVNNSTRTLTRTDVSKQPEGIKDDYSEDSRSNMNTSTAPADRGRRRPDKDQEKTSSTRSRIKLTPDRKSGKFNKDTSKTKNHRRSNEKIMCRTLKDSHEDSSSSLSKRERYRNESHYNKYDNRSNSRETDYRHRVSRSPSIERRSRDFEGSHRTYRRPKSQRNRTPSMDRKRTRSRGSREKRKDRLRSDPKETFKQGDDYRDYKMIILDEETYFSNDPVTFVENDPRSGQYRNIKEETDLKIIPLYKDDNINGANDIKQEWCAESPNSKEWSYENALASDLSANANKIEKYDEPVDHEMGIKDEQQELIPNTKLLECNTTKEKKEPCLESAKITRTKDRKTEHRRSTKESNTKTKEKSEVNNYQNGTTYRKNISKNTEEDKKFLKEHDAALISDNLQSKIRYNLTNSNNLSNEGLDESIICSINTTNLKEDVATNTISINAQESNFIANNSLKTPSEREPKVIQITDVETESDSGIIVQKEVPQNNDVNGKIFKSHTLHEQENMLNSMENDISNTNKEITSINSTVLDTTHTSITETTPHHNEFVNENTHVSQGYDENILISTLNYVKEDIIVKMEENVTENKEDAICSQVTSSATNIIKTNDSKENYISNSKHNEIPKTNSESTGKQNKLMIRRRKTVVKRKE